MSGQNNRRTDPGQSLGHVYAVMGMVGLLLLVIAGMNLGVRRGNQIEGRSVELSRNPMQVVIEVFTGAVAWPAASTGVAIALGVAVVVLVILVALGMRRLRKQRSRVDRAAAYMGRGRDVENLGRRGAMVKAKRMGVESPGVPIGRTVAAGAPLFGSWQDLHIDIWGPRTGKTTSRAVPAILEPRGSVWVTSNKRDVVDATRDVREKNGPVWVFDPQAIALEEPTGGGTR